MLTFLEKKKRPASLFVPDGRRDSFLPAQDTSIEGPTSSTHKTCMYVQYRSAYVILSEKLKNEYGSSRKCCIVCGSMCSCAHYSLSLA